MSPELAPQHLSLDFAEFLSEGEEICTIYGSECALTVTDCVSRPLSIRQDNNRSRRKTDGVAPCLLALARRLINRPNAGTIL
jgi:hypothetical protein